MINSTSGVRYSLASSTSVGEAYLITDPAGQWSDFKVEQGRKMFAGDVRIRNIFNNKCLTGDGRMDPTFVDCEDSNANQVSPLPRRYEGRKR